jgi:hypothetical protein
VQPGAGACGFVFERKTQGASSGSGQVDLVFFMAGQPGHLFYGSDWASCFGV